MSDPKIDQFLTVDQVLILKPNANRDQLEAIIEDIFAVVKTLCPAICNPDWKDRTTIRSVMRKAVIRSLNNIDGFDTLTQSQGENSQTVKYLNDPGNFFLLKDEKDMIAAACRAYQEYKGTLKKNRGAAEATRIRDYSNSVEDIFGNGFVARFPNSQIGPIKVYSSLPLED